MVEDNITILHILSPSINLDNTWTTVQDYIDMKLQPFEDEQLYFGLGDPLGLSDMIYKLNQVDSVMEKHNSLSIFQFRVVIDDFADNPGSTRSRGLLHSSYVRRHESSI